MKPVLQGNCFSLSSLAFHYNIFSPTFCPSNLPSALRRSPDISFFCHLTLLLIAQSLSPLTVLVVENTQSLTDKHRYTHSHARYHRVYHNLSKPPRRDNVLILEKPSIGVDNTNESRLLLLALAVCSQYRWLSDAH